MWSALSLLDLVALLASLGLAGVGWMWRDRGLAADLATLAGVGWLTASLARVGQFDLAVLPPGSGSLGAVHAVLVGTSAVTVAVLRWAGPLSRRRAYAAAFGLLSVALWLVLRAGIGPGPGAIRLSYGSLGCGFFTALFAARSVVDARKPSEPGAG